jgi:hypothetical protein
VARRDKVVQLSIGRGYGSASPLTPREVADEITLLIEAASFPAPRFEPEVIDALAALAAALRDGTDPSAVERPLRMLEHTLTVYGEKVASYFELLLPQLRACLAANRDLQSDESNWSVSWCAPSKGKTGAKPCTQRTCKREIIRTLCLHLNAVGLHFVELRRFRYRWAALDLVMQLVHGLHDSIDKAAPPSSRAPDRGDGGVVGDLVAALQGPLLGLLARCPCSSLQHVALGTLLRMREDFAVRRAQRAFKATKHDRYFAIYRYMLLGAHPAPSDGHPAFRGSDDYPLTAAEYAKLPPPEPPPPGPPAVAKPVRPGTITVALHDTVHHIRVHL